MDITDREIDDLLHELDDVPEPSGADGGTDVANADREPSDDDDGNGAAALPSPARPNGPSFTFRLTPDDEFETHEPVPWLIDGILPVGAEAKIVGDSGESLRRPHRPFLLATVSHPRFLEIPNSSNLGGRRPSHASFPG